jgi:DNA-binding transcriptional LysR family regulator
MRLRYIELFHAILSTGSLTGAARLLNISQPAASKALQHAEDQLGFAMFSRVHGRLRPTPQALLMRQRIDDIMQEVHDLQRLTSNISQPEGFPLRVTCTPTLAMTLLADAAVLLREAFPGTSAELSTQHSVAMTESLVLRETDIGITLQGSDHYNLRQEALCHGRVMVIAPPGWWSDADMARPLPVSELANQPMVGITVRDALGSLLQSHLAQVDPAPRISVWVQTYQLAYSLVAKGEGLALVDPFSAHCGLTQSVQIRPLKQGLDVVLYAMYRSDSPLSPVQKRFVALVRQLARELLTRD